MIHTKQLLLFLCLQEGLDSTGSDSEMGGGTPRPLTAEGGTPGTSAGTPGSISGTPGSASGTPGAVPATPRASDRDARGRT